MFHTIQNHKLLVLLVSFVFVCALQNSLTSTSRAKDSANSLISDRANSETSSLSSYALESEPHLLVDTIDLASFGDVDVRVLVPEGPMVSTVMTLTDNSTSWQKAYSIALAVKLKAVGLPVPVLVYGALYKFNTPEEARAAVDFLPNDPGLLNSTLRAELKDLAITHRVWYQIDNEGLPTYGFWLQSGSSVVQVINVTEVGQENFAKNILNHTVHKLISKLTGQNTRWQIYLPVIELNSATSPSKSLTSSVQIAEQVSVASQQSIVRFWGDRLVPEPKSEWPYVHWAVEWDLPGGSNPYYIDMYGDRLPVCIPVDDNQKCGTQANGSSGSDQFCAYDHIGTLQCYQEPWAFWGAPAGKTRLGILTRILLWDQASLDDYQAYWDHRNYSVEFHVGETSTPPASSTPIPSPTSSTPTPPPTNVPGPSSDGIKIMSVSSHNVQPGQQFDPSVKILVESGQLLPPSQRGDHLHAIPEDTTNTFGAYPVQAIKRVVTAVDEYTFDVNNDAAFRMTAPNTPGTYVSRWQMRVGGNYIGPVIEIPITVGSVASPPRPDGWRAQYWNGYYSDNPWGNGRCREDDFTGSIPFTKYWGGGGPGGGCNGERFSVLYERRFDFTGGRYRFHCHRDGYCRIFIPELGIDHAEEAGPFAGMDWGVDIRPGNWEVKIEYSHRRENGDSRLEFWWQGPDSYLPPLDADCAAHPYEWCAAYRVSWDSPSDSYIMRRLEGSGYIDHDWGSGSPGYGIYADFSAEWSRLVRFDAGLYRFHVTHDHGAKIAVDGQEILNRWGTCCHEDTADIWLATGDHRISVNWFDSGGDANLKVWWETITACYRLETQIDPSDAGVISLDPAPNCPVDTTKYMADTPVTLQANANAGNSFWLWRGEVNDSSNPATIVMNWNKQLTAHFLVDAQTPVLTPTDTPSATPAPASTNTPLPANEGDLLTSFEAGIDGLHINPAADNSATNVASSTEHATDGSNVAQLEFTHDHSIHQRATYQFDLYPYRDWSVYDTLQFNLWTNQPIEIALAIGTGPSWSWFESGLQELLVGNNTIQFDLMGAVWNGNGNSNISIADLNDVRYVALLIYPSGDGQDAVFLDNFRLYPGQLSPTATETPTPGVTDTPTSEPISTLTPTATSTPVPSTPTATATDMPTITPSPTSAGAANEIELLADGAWHLSGSNGADEDYQSIPTNALQGKDMLRITYNLHGIQALGGDASAIIFDQGDWRYISLSDYGQNGLDGEQTVDIPLSDFPGLNSDASVGTLHTRFWYNDSFVVDISSIVAYSSQSQPPVPTSTPTATSAPATSTTTAANTPTATATDTQAPPTPTVTSTPVLPTATATNTPTATAMDTPTVTPTPTSVGVANEIELLTDGAWHLSGSNGADEDYQSIPGNALQGKDMLRITYNLHGLQALGGDASAIIFDQGDWRYISLSDYGQNGLDGEQTVDIPLSDFPGLDPDADVGTLHTRFWYNDSFVVDISSIVAYSSVNAASQ